MGVYGVLWGKIGVAWLGMAGSASQASGTLGPIFMRAPIQASSRAGCFVKVRHISGESTIPIHTDSYRFIPNDAAHMGMAQRRSPAGDWPTEAARLGMAWLAKRA